MHSTCQTHLFFLNLINVTPTIDRELYAQPSLRLTLEKRCIIYLTRVAIYYREEIRQYERRKVISAGGSHTTGGTTCYRQNGGYSGPGCEPSGGLANMRVVK